MSLLIFGRGAEVHRTDNCLDEGNLRLGEVILGVEVFVRPPLRPLLRRHEGVNFARRVLRGLVQKYQETSQPTRQIG